MNQQIQNFLINQWYKKNLFSWMLWPFSILYTFLRQRDRRRGLALSRTRLLEWKQLCQNKRLAADNVMHQTPTIEIPIIVIGNLIVGGSGKTPTLLSLYFALEKRGFKVGIISRGYGSECSEPTLVEKTHTAQQVGDEPLLLFLKTSAPIVVSPDRWQAALFLIQKVSLIDIILSDDGLQHEALPRHYEIIVMDGRRGIGNGKLLPAGPLRDSWARANLVDMVLWREQRIDSLSKSLSKRIIQASVVMHVSIPQPIHNRPFYYDGFWQKNGWPSKVHAVCGIAYPQGFFNALKSHGVYVIEHAFPDHWQFSKTDFEFDDVTIPICMTEKDATKCAEIAKSHWFVVPLRAEIEEYAVDAMMSKIAPMH
ncbi:MAG: tetraacyldisaccharide 4'-kinase [Pseudomonadota bacterium]